MQTTTISRVDTPRAAASAAALPTGRHDGYINIHKALRLFMTHVLTRIGSTDPADAADVTATLDQVSELLTLCELHIKDENEFIHPALERAQPGSSARIAHEHAHHAEAFSDLHDLVGLVVDTEGAARAVALSRLYRAFALFVADNFAHMHVEETEHNAVLWAHYSDAELIAIEHALVGSLPPQAVVKMLDWFLPAMNASERAGMLRGMQMASPPDAFRGVLDIAQRVLAPREFDKLLRALNVSASR